MKIFRKFNWLLPLAVVLFLLIIRIPSFFGPQFSSDEGYYLSIAQSLSHGDLLYRDIWDNKPPLLYVLFGLNSLLFGNTIIPLRVLGFLLSLVSIYLVDKIAKRVFEVPIKARLPIIVAATLLFSFYFEMTLFNAENIFVPLVLAGFYSWYEALRLNKSSNDSHTRNGLDPKQFVLIILAGLSWALASWTKLNTIPEIAVLAAVSIVINYKNEPSDIKSLPKLVGTFGSRMLILAIPGICLWLGTVIFFSLNNGLTEFFDGVIGFSGNYLEYGQKPLLLGIPIPFINPLVMNTVLVGIIFILTTFWFLKSSRHASQSFIDADTIEDASNKSNTDIFDIFSDKNLYMLINWFSVCVLAVFLSSRGYPHYLQQLLPVLAILLGAVWHQLTSAIDWKWKFSTAIIPLILLHFILNSFTNGSGIYNWFGWNRYYGGFIKYALNQQTFNEWEAQFDANSYSRRTEFSQYVMDTKASERIYIVGSIPELYSVTQTYPGYRLIVDYHIKDNAQVESIVQELVESSTLDVYIDATSGYSNEFISQLQQNGYENTNVRIINGHVVYHFQVK